MNRSAIGRVIIICVMLAALTATIGCSTLVKGTKQEVVITSNPSGASVFVNNQSFGQTPAVVKLRRTDNYTILLELSGFAPYEIKLDRKTNILFWVNIPVLGQVVDAFSGAMYELTPAEINKQFAQSAPVQQQPAPPRPTSQPTVQPQPIPDTTDQQTPADTSGMSWLPDEDTYYIFVTMNPDPSWKKIGQLTPLTETK